MICLKLKTIKRNRNFQINLILLESMASVMLYAGDSITNSQRV
nr:MAG TPA: hypothetical protein [Caudoviricetes sp.]